MDNSKKSAGMIYTVENEITGEFYIGATTDSVEKRKKDHLQKVNGGSGQKFHEAISTYGVEAFNWEQIDTANSKDELAKKEQSYIVKYNSKEDGYNSSIGGELKKTVYKYDLNDGSLVNTYSCLDEASKSIDGIKQQISRACLSVNKVFSGYYWSYKYKEPFESGIDNRIKQVHQFDLNGEFLFEFKSVSKASELTGCNKSSIAKVCRGIRNHAGGFIWKYK